MIIHNLILSWLIKINDKSNIVILEERRLLIKSAAHLYQFIILDFKNAGEK